MMKHTYGDRGYLAVEGKDKALALASAILTACPENQVLIQNDDCDIYIVSWAARFYSQCEGRAMGDTFVLVDEDEYDDYLDWKESLKQEDNE